ncbi:RNA recognition motif domain-containing protein [Candidatus Nitrospira bockiana]
MRVFIDGLPPSYGSEDLRRLFSEFGVVIVAEVARNKGQESLQFGFVTMATSSEANRAVQALNRAVVEDHLLLVMPAENQWSMCRVRSTPRGWRGALP